MYRCIYDGDSFIDGIACNTLDEAQYTAVSILEDWLSEAVNLSDDDFNMMIYNCMTWVEEEDPETGELEDVWYPTEDILKSIGWVERG